MQTNLRTRSVHQLLIGALLAALAAAGCGGPTPEEAADLVLTGGKVVTVNPAQPVAEAVAVKGDRILAVGSAEEIGALVGDQTRVIALDGKTIVPGMIDAHVHFSGIGSRLRQLDAGNAENKDVIVERVAERVANAQPGEWIRGRGWDQNTWPEKVFPTKEDLDAVSPNNPVYLGRVDGHAAWVNSEALRIAGITKDTPDPAGGQIIRDENGEPTGTLVDNGFRLVSQHIPPSEGNPRETIKMSIQECLSLGLTGVHEAGAGRETAELYEDMMKADEFPFRINMMVRWPLDEQTLPHTYDRLDYFLERGPQTGLYDNRLTIRTIKMSLDGALGSRGAAFLEDYDDNPGNKGVLRLTPDEVHETIVRGLRAGFSTAVHCIGDRSNRIALDAMEQALQEVPTEDARLRIEHAQVLDPDDVQRFGELGIIPSMQPTHCTTDMHWIETRLGLERPKFAYAWRTLLDSGCRIPGGSDAPVESENPLYGIHAAVTRQDREGWPEGGWHPEQRVSREEALRMFTIDAAYASFEEDVKGSLEPGKLADIAVLEKDIMTIPAEEIRDTQVLMTIVGGKIVYEKTD